MVILWVVNTGGMRKVVAWILALYHLSEGKALGPSGCEGVAEGLAPFQGFYGPLIPI